MNSQNKIIVFLILIPFIFIVCVLGASSSNAETPNGGKKDNSYTKTKGAGPMYWIAYEYCWTKNSPIPEAIWKANIDWIDINFKPYGYDMICNDGWIEAAQTINANGYITKYNSNWTKGFSEWHQYLAERDLKMGVYYNPMWLTKAAFDKNVQVKGTSYHARDIVGPKSFNDALYWVDAGKPGAKEWIQGYVSHFKDAGATYLRVDFLENYETNYGTAKYDQALGWIKEITGDDLFLSLVMPNCYNHAVTELKYGDMIRIDDDCFEGDWEFVSNRRRGQQNTKWPQFGNAFDGFIGFADISGRGQMILDGDFMRMNKLASDNERKFLFSLMIMGGSALAIADQYNTIGNHGWVYKNTELNELNKLGFVAKPLSYDYNDAKNSSRWTGQLPNGDWIVGLFNRENTDQQRSIDFSRELGLTNDTIGNIRDLWSHKDLGSMSGEYSITLAPHDCQILRISTDSKLKKK